jgi:glycosyltransferase involved in cell wall biosynthesis
MNITFYDEDMIIVPEVMAGTFDNKIKARKIVFIQSLSLIFRDYPLHLTHKQQGFEIALTCMPHMREPVEKYLKIPVYSISPFVASYFFVDEKRLHKREKLIVLYPKFQQAEYSLIMKLIIDNFILNQDTPLKSNRKQWSIMELQGLTHEQVAAVMKKAMFFVCTNTFESFNASVPEAMAAGCINICYEAFGPKDFLENGKNAFVFPNHEPFLLVEKLIELISNYEANEEGLYSMRIEAMKTASRYRREVLVKEIVEFFKLQNTTSLRACEAIQII